MPARGHEHEKTVKESCMICTDSADYLHVDCEAGPATHPANEEAVSRRARH